MWRNRLKAAACAAGFWACAAASIPLAHAVMVTEPGVSVFEISAGFLLGLVWAAAYAAWARPRG